MTIKEKLQRLGGKKYVYLASVGTLLLAAIMVVLPVISASRGSRSASATLFYSVGGPEALNAIFMLLLLGATALSAMGLYTSKQFRMAHLILGFIVRIFVFLLLISFVAYLEGSRGGSVDYGYTFAGWLLILCTVGGFVLDILSMGAFKKAKIQNNATPYDV